MAVARRPKLSLPVGELVTNPLDCGGSDPVNGELAVVEAAEALEHVGKDRGVETGVTK
jgi:hypothetical protein